MTKKVVEKNELWSIGTDTFSKMFYLKEIKVYLRNGHFINGLVSEIGLACNLNTSTNEHLPATITIDNKKTGLTDIVKIEIL